MAKANTKVNYNALVDLIQGVEKHTVKSEKKKAMKKLSEFLEQEGFTLLAPAVMKFASTLE